MNKDNKQNAYLRELEKEEEQINKVFKRLLGQKIKRFLVKVGVDQHFHLVTDKVELKFGANDLGVWIEEFKPIKTRDKK